MCNRELECLRYSQFQTPLGHEQAVQGMETTFSPSLVASPTLGTGGENPRVKFLCSFGGSILPRPLDGKLRYVGGETRIVSIPRDISYTELMQRMKELFEGVTTLKYQQPDEDLDALVSVVNDDDVTNMMEEYDKLGAGDGFTRIRIFLFSNFDNDMAQFNKDERETERRYVDALNSLNDSPGSDKVHSGSDQFLPSTPMQAHFNLHLAIPHPPAGHGLPQQSHGQRFNHSDMEPPWSPAHYSSSGSLAPQDPRLEFPLSPSGRYQLPFGDTHERIAEEYTRQTVNHQYDHQPQPFVENVVWMPPGSILSEKGGFPANLGHSHNNNNGFEGNSICDHCRMGFQRTPDARWRNCPPHMEHVSSVNDFTQVTNPYPESFPRRDTPILNQENEPLPFYNETHNLERGWAPHLQLNHRQEELRPHLSVIGRVNEHYVADGSGMNFSLDGHSLLHDGGKPEDPRYPCASLELTEVHHEHSLGNGPNLHLHEQTVTGVSHLHTVAVEGCGICYGNVVPNFGVDNLHPHGSPPLHALRRKLPNTIHGGPSYEVLGLISQSDGAAYGGLLKGPQEGSPRFSRRGLEEKSLWSGDPQTVSGLDGPARLNQGILVPSRPDPVHPHSGMQDRVISSPSIIIDQNIVGSPGLDNKSKLTDGNDVISLGKSQEAKDIHGETNETADRNTSRDVDVQSTPSCKKNEGMTSYSNGSMSAQGANSSKLNDHLVDEPLKNETHLVQHLSSIPELIASVKKVALENADVKERAEEPHGLLPQKDTSLQESEPMNAKLEPEQDSDNESSTVSKIEPTKAEAEALAKGLQTVKNADLEEVRELGSGTYGAVYHGKWRGSDVAIKRIKASCFSGRPSERERLIADFWKEALILSSLHHPNVVSFYGIVRDGPDGSLATVTEFMVNGSLKQFLQKKDRTIDRRKRLIIAMDAAFGMEYLHGKNIVHFDLKCENLLVNMRDPQRPVCKIGDLGLSKVKQQTLVSGGVRGTLPWMAPELLSGKSNMVTEKIDVYSFGIVMWELLTGEEPYADMHCASIIGGIVNNTLRPQIPAWCDPEWKSLMESCWCSNPGERPSFSEISQKLRKMAAAMNVK